MITSLVNHWRLAPFRLKLSPMSEEQPTRRKVLETIVTASALAATGCAPPARRETTEGRAVLGLMPLGFQWPTREPFLFCVHHDDHYPRGNAQMGPAASLAGRNIGSDFEGIDGWRMYHGDVVPGFPEHPHRGFETVTVVRRGLLDHSDSMGATARYGGGDVQWLTAGRGIQHAEMFPLVRENAENPVELFQIWLNLPRANKMVEPHFSMLWNEQIPRRTVHDGDGRTTEITVVAGHLSLDGVDTAPLAPPPSSWAAREENDVAIWTLKMAPGARVVLPPARDGSNRDAYFFLGNTLHVDGHEVRAGHRIELRADVPVELVNGAGESEILLLQARPIGEPIARYGPFVMNSDAEIRQAYSDFQRTRFGGWPWERHDPVHPRTQGRFARRPDGSTERPASTG